MKRKDARLVRRSAADRRLLLAGLACLLVVLLLAGVAGAQVSTSYDLSWWVFDGGNGLPNSDSYSLYSVLGQGIVGFGSGPGLGVDSGQPPMVPGVPASAFLKYGMYLPIVLRSAP